MHFVFVMDPLSTVRVDEDTTFALMLEAQSRGHRVDYCEPQDVELDRGEVIGRIRSATMQRDPVHPIQLGPAQRLPLAKVDAVFVRKDPPFDPPYLWLTLVLEHLRGRTTVVNDPRGLRDANEKLYACNFPEVMPATLVASDKARIREFLRELGGQAVIKPVDGHGGDGVFVLREGDLNLNAIIEAVTRSGSRVAMVQAFLPEVREGDKRILLVDGEPLGAILRVPRADDARSNIHVGGSVVAAKIEEDDRRIVEAVAPWLRDDGLFFVGLDVIGGRLTEVNVTSPTGIQQMSRLSGENLEAVVIDALEKKARAL